jgi:hypothetical protein
VGALAQRVPIQDRAQALSLPIPTVALIRGATSIASQVAHRVGQAIGFDDVLRGGNSEPGVNVTALTDQLVQTVGAKLSESGIAVNRPLRLSVQGDGTLRVEGDHPRAAEIEALLASDESLAQQVRGLTAAGGPREILVAPATPIGLTPTRLEANILERHQQ